VGAAGSDVDYAQIVKAMEHLPPPPSVFMPHLTLGLEAARMLADRTRRA